MRRKRIIVLLADMQSEYNHTLMEGITKQAYALDMDIVTFSFFSNLDQDTPFQTGEENIFSLCRPEYADGILMQKSNFQKQAVQQRIAQFCQDSGLPYLDMELETAGDRYPVWNDRRIFRDLVRHLITVHGKRKIFCLTGLAGSHQSEDRLAGFRMPAQRRGLPGDGGHGYSTGFWKAAGVPAPAGNRRRRRGVSGGSRLC